MRAGRKVAAFLLARYCGAMKEKAGQATLAPQKRKGPAPTGKGTSINVRLQPSDLTALDSWIDAQDDQPSRPEAVRQLMRLGMTAQQT